MDCTRWFGFENMANALCCDPEGRMLLDAAAFAPVPPPLRSIMRFCDHAAEPADLSADRTSARSPCQEVHTVMIMLPSD
jgi:hypothetical protein